jgi:protein involved in polysaccharide export with SLBB domain
MRKTIIFGLALIVASVLSVTAEDMPGRSSDNNTGDSTIGGILNGNTKNSNKNKSATRQENTDVAPQDEEGNVTQGNHDTSIDTDENNNRSVNDDNKTFNYRGPDGVLLPFGMSFFYNASRNETAQPSSIPLNYVLRYKDKIVIISTSSLGAQKEYYSEVSPDGTVNIPGLGKIKASGMTLAQLSNMANKRINSRFKQMKLDITLASVAPVIIQVAGSVVRPGTYTMSGMSTVMSALYRSGGPSANGTMRNISLSRAGMPKLQIDLYKFLMDGSRNQDYALRDGDLIFVPPIGKTIVIDGEVIRPATYEPKFPLTLSDALKMAGGVKSSGYLQQVSVERVENGENRILVNASIQVGAASKSVILPGDQITVSSVRPERTNVVTISGPVSVPGAYEHHPNMRVSELITMAQGIDINKSVYTDRADILRLDPIKGTELISFDLSKALTKDPEQDIELQKLDKVFIYIPDQVAFSNYRVRISGAVSKPGVYDRKYGMNINDLVAAAGGVIPEAYLQRADLLRYKSNGIQELVIINLGSALNKDKIENIKLNDRDELMIYTTEEAGWKDSRVRIEGSVQRPGTYKRVDNMRISDLIFAAGGLLPEAGKLAEIGRVVLTGQPNIIKVNLDGLVPSSEQDLLISDRDTVTIPSVNSILRVPEVVYLSGEVINPGPYTLSSSTERLSEVIKRAGGLTSRADNNCLIFMRDKKSFDNEQQRRDVQTIIKAVLLFADRQFVTQLSQMGIKLPDNFLEKTQQSATELANPLGASEIRKQQDGIVRNDENTNVITTVVPDTKGKNIQTDNDPEFGKSAMEDKEANLNKTTSNKKVGSQVETIEEAISRLAPAPVEPERAFGERLAKLSNKETSGLAAVANAEDLLELARISVNFKKALDNPGTADDLIMRSGDRLHIPMVTDTITVLGAVLHPHVFASGSDKSVAYYVERSGGYARDAATGSTVIVHTNGDAVPASSVKTVLPGDIIVVPNNGLIDVAKKWEKIGSVTKIISDVLSSVFVLTRF